jgi:hypothetical protein
MKLELNIPVLENNQCEELGEKTHRINSLTSDKLTTLDDSMKAYISFLLNLNGSTCCREKLHRICYQCKPVQMYKISWCTDMSFA